MTPALEDHSFAATELPFLLPSLNDCHQLVVFFSTFVTLMDSFLNYQLLMLSQLLLCLSILLSLDVDHVLIDLCLLDTLPEFTLSFLSHELG